MFYRFSFNVLTKNTVHLIQLALGYGSAYFSFSTFFPLISIPSTSFFSFFFLFFVFSTFGHSIVLIYFFSQLIIFVLLFLAFFIFWLFIYEYAPINTEIIHVANLLSPLTLRVITLAQMLNLIN